MVGKNTKTYNAHMILLLLVSAVIILSVGCGAEDIGSVRRHEIPVETDITLNVSSAKQLSTPPELQPLTTENSIDRVFTRISAEQYLTLEGNATFAYLYALKWYEAFQSLSSMLQDTNQPLLDPSRCQYQSTDAADTTVVRYSDLATTRFEEIAYSYKMLYFDCIARLNIQSADVEMNINEDELYLYLSRLNYSMQLHDDYLEYLIEYTNETECISNNPMPVVSDLRDSEIYISYAYPFGIVLSVRDEEYLYTWHDGDINLRMIPRLSIYDYDGDGTSELAVAITTGYGTECSIDELHIVEINDNMIITTVTSDTIESLLDGRLSALYDPITEAIMVRLDDETVSVNYHNSCEENEKEFQRLDLSSIIYFYEEDGLLKVKVSIGLLETIRATPFYYVYFYADVAYAWANNEYYGVTPEISLHNYRIESNGNQNDLPMCLQCFGEG